MKPTQRELKRLCHYDPETGIFKRILVKTWKGEEIKCDRVVDKPTSYGYYQINIFGRPHAVHRLIFLYMMGRLPKADVDHINGDRIDNRWVNLRQVSRRENMMNVGVRSNSTTGVTGVSARKDNGKFQAYIDVNGVRTRLGCYETIDEARAVRRAASANNEFHPNHGERARWQK